MTTTQRLAPLFFSLAIGTMACSSSPADDAPEHEGPPATILPASRATTTALGVTEWHVTMVDGRYAVGGFDDNRELKAGMQTQAHDEGDGVLLTEVVVDVGKLHLSKRFATKGGQTAFAQDEIADNALAQQVLDLIGVDLKLAPRNLAGGVRTQAIRPLDETATDQPGTGNGFEVYGPNCNKSCARILNQTNDDCHSTGYCSSKNLSACGGSNAQCQADQAYAKNAGCDRQCASSVCRGGAPELVCKNVALICSHSQCTSVGDANCRQYGAVCTNSQTARDENHDGSYGL